MPSPYLLSSYARNEKEAGQLSNSTISPLLFNGLLSTVSVISMTVEIGPCGATRQRTRPTIPCKPGNLQIPLVCLLKLGS